MNKCPKCGTEFEGTFCPECGEKFSESKKCPQCGNECAGGVKFCPACGYDFYGKKEQATPAAPAAGAAGAKKAAEFSEHAKATFGKLHKILNWLPALLFALFSALTFAFFAAPVAVMTDGGLGELLGGGSMSESFGNMYSAYSGQITDLPLKGCGVAAMVFAVLSIVLTAFAAFTLLNRYLAASDGSPVRVNAFTRAKRAVLRGAEVYSYVIYFIFVIISAVIMGKTGEADEGAGLLSAGAGTILLMVFPLVFAAIALGGKLFDRLYILNNFPELATDGALPAIPYTGKEPVSPEHVDEPALADSPAYNEVVLQEFLRMRRMSVLLPLLMFVVSAVIWISMMIQSFVHHQDMPVPIQVLIIILFILACVGLILILRMKNANALNVSARLRYLFPFCVILWAAGSLMPFWFTVLDFQYAFEGHSFNVPYISLLASVIYPILVALSVICIVVFGLLFFTAKEYRKAFYGSTKYTDGMSMTAYGKEFIEKQKAYLSEVSKYKVYMAKVRSYKSEVRKCDFNKSMCDVGEDYHDKKARRAFWLRGHKYVLAGIALAAAAVITIAVVLPVTVTLPGGGLDGTYYAYRSETYDENNYIIISGNTWKDDDGMSGTLQRNGDSLSFTYDFFGSTEELYSGTYISEGVIQLKVSAVSTVYYCVKGKVPPKE